MPEPRMPSLLSERRLFSFDAEARHELASFFTTLDPPYGLLCELVCLTAAELSLTPVIVDPRPILPVPKPIAVDASWTRLAIAKADCVNIEWCIGRTRGTERLTLPDVTAFGGDISKLAAVGVEEELTEIGNVARAVDVLERAHRDSPAGLTRRLGESGVLRLQGFLWSVKFALPRGELEQSVSDAFDAFELHHPVGGVLAPA